MSEMGGICTMVRHSGCWAWRHRRKRKWSTVEGTMIGASGADCFPTQQHDLTSTRVIREVIRGESGELSLNNDITLSLLFLNDESTTKLYHENFQNFQAFPKEKKFAAGEKKSAQKEPTTLLQTPSADRSPKHKLIELPHSSNPLNPPRETVRSVAHKEQRGGSKASRYGWLDFNTSSRLHLVALLGE
jgi:hypothetical protein